jgi:hypothetical protein
MNSELIYTNFLTFVAILSSDYNKENVGTRYTEFEIPSLITWKYLLFSFSPSLAQILCRY